MKDKERYIAIKILDAIDMYVNLDSLCGPDREEAIKLIVMNLREYKGA